MNDHSTASGDAPSLAAAPRREMSSVLISDEDITAWRAELVDINEKIADLSARRQRIIIVLAGMATLQRLNELDEPRGLSASEGPTSPEAVNQEGATHQLVTPKSSEAGE